MSVINKVILRGRRLLFSPSRWLERRVERSSSALVHLGTSYGGWTIADPGERLPGIAVLCGAGEDISFDLGLQSRYDCEILIVDPTPRAIDHFEQVVAAGATGSSLPIDNGSERYALCGVNFRSVRFVPLALWVAAGTLKFWAPANAAHVSHSITNLQHSDHYLEVKAETLTGILAQHGYAPEQMSLLKLDIEGAETEVIHWLCDNYILPPQVLVEFDEMNNPTPAAARKVKAAAERLFEQGYQLAHFDGQANCLFLRATPTKSPALA